MAASHEEPPELKRFDIQDGMGITMAAKAGLTAGILTGRSSPMVERRARELSIAVVKQGFHDKIEGFKEILAEREWPGQSPTWRYSGPARCRARGVLGSSANRWERVPRWTMCQRTGGHGAVRSSSTCCGKRDQGQVIAAITGTKP
jgi:3-deoxy-D-manno-octulosonate 8-phosphate phosphatase (KDO 8-P phosphatase)